MVLGLTLPYLTYRMITLYVTLNFSAVDYDYETDSLGSGDSGSDVARCELVSWKFVLERVDLAADRWT